MKSYNPIFDETRCEISQLSQDAALGKISGTTLEKVLWRTLVMQSWGVNSSKHNLEYICRH